MREFWIQKGTPDFIADSFQESEGFCNEERCELPVIHVIEYSSYEQIKHEFKLLQECAHREHLKYIALEEKLKIAREALGKYLNLNISVCHGKKQLQDKDISLHDNERIDFDFSEIAKETLGKIR